MPAVPRLVPVAMSISMSSCARMCPRSTLATQELSPSADVTLRRQLPRAP